MKIKDSVIVVTLCLLTLGLYFLIPNYNKNDKINNVFNVYLNGDIIGVIDDKEALYALIDEHQQSIKNKYNVSNVYPPSSLQIIETYSYDSTISNLEEVYNKIDKLQDFTIQGYEVKVSAYGDHEEFNFYILDKNILEKALKEFILAFINENNYEEYMNGSQKDLEDVGINYVDMEILEDITIREKYISINDKIYEDSAELAQALLFGFNYKEKSYTVKEGDTIESISEANTLNTQEFLIANPEYSSKDSLLTIGDKVNITLINPEISLSYTVYELKEVEIPFEKNVVRDSSKPSNWEEITKAGVTGLSIQQSHYKVVNGEPNSEITFDSTVVIREKVDQVITKGRKEYIGGNETFVDTGTGWTWPTGSPFRVTSEYAPRWGKYHNGMDISGTGKGSKIYAANDGVVVAVNSNCPNEGKYGSTCGNELGNYVIINHGNNIYTLYGHMLNNVPVKVGQKVSKKDVVGYMGNSGSSTGTHLHFGLSIGEPFKGGTFRNPRELFPR